MQRIKSLLGAALMGTFMFTAAHAQTVNVNSAACPGATVTFGQGVININTSNCSGGPMNVAPSITASSPPGGTVLLAYNYTFQATGTPTAMTWAITAGSLPAGLTLNTTTGQVTGSPTATGTSTFTISASNGVNPAASASPTITVSANTTPPTITAFTPPNGTTGVVYSYSFGGNAVGTWGSTGTLPTGLTLNTTSGLLSGTPTAAGTFPFTVTASNGNMPNASQNVSVTIAQGVPPVITSGAPTATGTTNTIYPAFTFAASGTTPQTWTVASGALPAGLTLSTAGVLSGTPTATGTFMFAVQVANGTTPNATSATYTIAVAQGTGLLQALDGTPIPEPSKNPGVPGAVHAGPMGGGNVGGLEIRGYSYATTACGAAAPQVNTLWLHNIDFLAYATSSTIDYVTFSPGQALSYRFTIPTGAQPQYGWIEWTQFTQATQPTSFISISTSLCDFDVAKAAAGDFCYKSNTSDNGFLWYISSATYGGCKLETNRTYYLNIRWKAATGNTSLDGCNPQNGTECGGLMRVKRNNVLAN